MGSAGHAFMAHTKALSPSASVKDGGWGNPPHPLEVRPGQRFWPREGRRKRPFLVKRVSGETVIGQRLDESRDAVRMTRGRLLAVRPQDGQGLHYSFNGCASRRYPSYAAVVAVEDDGWAVLVVPEWHPARPVRLPLRQLPAGSDAGSWFAVVADLGASSAPRLSLHGFRVVEDPGPAVAHRPCWSPSG